MQSSRWVALKAKESNPQGHQVWKEEIDDFCSVAHQNGPIGLSNSQDPSHLLSLGVFGLLAGEHFRIELT